MQRQLKLGAGGISGPRCHVRTEALTTCKQRGTCSVSLLNVLSDNARVLKNTISNQLEANIALSRHWGTIHVAIAVATILTWTSSATHHRINKAQSKIGWYCNSFHCVGHKISPGLQ